MRIGDVRAGREVVVVSLVFSSFTIFFFFGSTPSGYLSSGRLFRGILNLIGLID